MTFRTQAGILIFILCCIAVFSPSPAFLQQNKTFKIAPEVNKLTLSQAVMCEDIKDFEPFNEAIVFSIALGKVNCFTFFEFIPEKTVIYHNWYFHDQLTAKVKLTLKPPSWKTYSTIQLREVDKGPWRVEITDARGRVFKVLRFSIVD